jgi:hypothetical protein
MNVNKQKEKENQLLNVITQKKWMRWSHIDWNVVGFSRQTAYVYELDKSDIIKDRMAENRSKAVDYLLQKWIASDNATLQIAAMRIVAEEDDRQRLNQQYIDNTTKGEKIENRLQVEIIRHKNEQLQEDSSD